jgi:hypothetical protein
MLLKLSYSSLLRDKTLLSRHGRKNGKPKVGRSARLLGVRLGIDIDVEEIPKGLLDDQGYLRPEAKRKPTGELVIVAIRSTKGECGFELV